MFSLSLYLIPMFLEMVMEEKDVELEEEIAEKIEGMEKRLALAELASMFDGEPDNSNAIMSIHAGAGGTEAPDWVGILMRLYLRWAEKLGFKTSLILNVMTFIESCSKLMLLV